MAIDDSRPTAEERATKAGQAALSSKNSPPAASSMPSVAEVDSGEGVPAQAGPTAPDEQRAEVPASGPEEGASGGPAEEGEASPAGGDEAGRADGEESELEGSASPPYRPRPRKAVRKTPSRPPRPSRVLPSMDDAMQAKRLLERVFLLRHREELCGLTLVDLLDIPYVDFLKAVNGVLALRGAIAGTSDSILQAERAKKYKRRCREIAGKYAQKLEEAKIWENDLGGKLLKAGVDRDTWLHKCREAVSLAAITRAQLTAAKAQLAMVKRSLEEARDGIGKLTKQLQEADLRANKAVFDAYSAGKRAEDAEARAEWVESQAAEGIAAAAGHAREAEARAAAADERAQDAESREAAADERARDAEARAAATNERARNAEARAKAAVWEFFESEEYQLEMAEAATDAYIKGFDLCKRRVAAVYKLEGLDAIQPSPSDDDETDGEGADESSKPAGQ